MLCRFGAMQILALDLAGPLIAQPAKESANMGDDYRFRKTEITRKVQKSVLVEQD
jgi:hypothetical protein